MFSKLAIIVAATFAATAVASPAIKNSCNTGPIQCCGTLVSPTSAAGIKALGLVNAVIPNLTGMIGAQCSPLTVVGVGKGGSWYVLRLRDYNLSAEHNAPDSSSTPVCCENNYSSKIFPLCTQNSSRKILTAILEQLVGVNCSPVTIG